MPRRYNKRNMRRAGAHSKYSNPYSGYLDTASKALGVAYAVKKLINVEYRSIVTDFTVDPNTTGTVQNLTAIAQGDTINARQGNKIRAKRIALSGNAVINASATQTRLRMLIVRDNNGSTSQPAIADLFDDVTSFRANKLKKTDPQNNSRFTVLWDKFIILDSINQSMVAFNWSMSLDHHIFYSGTASTDEGKGNLYLFMNSSEATNDPVVAADAAVFYIDN